MGRKIFIMGCGGISPITESHSLGERGTPFIRFYALFMQFYAFLMLGGQIFTNYTLRLYYIVVIFKKRVSMSPLNRMKPSKLYVPMLGGSQILLESNLIVQVVVKFESRVEVG